MGSIFYDLEKNIFNQRYKITHWVFTLSVLRYGDKAPKSVIARVLCILWIMVGLTLCSVMTATLTTALATAAVKDVDLVGKKVPIIKTF